MGNSKQQTAHGEGRVKGFSDMGSIPIISTIHYHVSGKIKENTGIVKLTLLCRCSLFLASIGWVKQSCPVFVNFVVTAFLGIVP